MEILEATPFTTIENIKHHTSLLANTGCYELSQLLEPVFSNWDSINSMLCFNSRPFQQFYEIKKHDLSNFTNHHYNKLLVMMMRLDLLPPPQFIIRLNIREPFGMTLNSKQVSLHRFRKTPICITRAFAKV